MSEARRALLNGAGKIQCGGGIESKDWRGRRAGNGGAGEENLLRAAGSVVGDEE